MRAGTPPRGRPLGAEEGCDVRALVVEDDEEDSRALVACLERFGRETGMRIAVDRRRSALEFAEGPSEADFLIFDIGLPGVSGMELARLLRARGEDMPLVFVTSLAQYAVRGYEVDAVGFVVKPIEYHDFQMAMRRVVRALKRSSGNSVAIPTKNGIRAIRYKDIVYIDIVKHDVNYHIVGEAEPFCVRGSLGKVESELEGSPFVRVSSSCIVNISHIQQLQGNEIDLANGEMAYISRSRKREVLEAVARYLGGA